MPPNLIFIPVDFNKETVSDVLALKGFEKDKTTLFLMEGLTMYLDSEAIEETFNLISECAKKGSEVLFDFIYASVIRRENLYYGENKLFKRVEKFKEQWPFGIEKDGIKDFLEKYHFKLKEQFKSEELEQRYFTNNAGEKIGRVNGTFCLVLAEK